MQQTINFCKMHGLGNDFVIIDGVTQSVSVVAIPIRHLSDRHLGIGFDQLLLIEPSTSEADFSCRIFNADGSEAEQCGNGMRCIARFIFENKLSLKKNLRIATKAGVIEADIHNFDHIKVNMGQPHLEGFHEVMINGQSISLFILSMGNPHAILQVASIKDFPVAEFGSQISTHAIFPQGTNVGFMEVVNRQHIRLRTFERGSRETYACGSNSCAAVVVGIKNNLLDQKVKVELTYGNLWVEWLGNNKQIVLTGTAQSVFSGSFNI